MLEYWSRLDANCLLKLYSDLFYLDIGAKIKRLFTVKYVLDNGINLRGETNET